jgi:hypothetical protein
MGFLFGIPRRPRGESNASNHQNDTTGKTEDKRHGFSHVNSNLERISDWLTSMIIGISLVEMRDIPGALYRLSAHVASGFDNGSGDKVSFATSLIIYFGVLGFISGYLMTRVYLSIAFKNADNSADPGRSETVESPKE